MKLIRQGAEANLYKKKDSLLKERIKKEYRVEKLDKQIRKQRTKSEAKLLRKALDFGVNVPKVIETKDFDLEIEFINGPRIKDNLNSKNYVGLCKQIGKSIATLHKHGIIHGDLTTSNMILKNDKIYFIDFGLGFFSRKIEDQATDLHLLSEAFESTHYQISREAFKYVIKKYQKNYERSEEVLRRLENIEQRGRYVKRGEE